MLEISVAVICDSCGKVGYTDEIMGIPMEAYSWWVPNNWSFTEDGNVYCEECEDEDEKENL